VKSVFDISIIFRREDPRDALVLHPKHEGRTLKTLPKGSVIGKQVHFVAALSAFCIIK
jgi:porphobilinogen deaminase